MKGKGLEGPTWLEEVMAAAVWETWALPTGLGSAHQTRWLWTSPCCSLGLCPLLCGTGWAKFSLGPCCSVSLCFLKPGIREGPGGREYK